MSCLKSCSCLQGLSQKHEFENKQNTKVGTSDESLSARKATQLLCI